jgi:hypothetical protein
MIRQPPLVPRISIVIKDSFSIDITVTHISTNVSPSCCNYGS